jgi:gamma-glutamyl phosphate reductase
MDAGTNEIADLMHEMGAKAQAAARALALATTEAKNQALNLSAESLRRRHNQILSANAKDMAEAEAKGISAGRDRRTRRPRRRYHRRMAAAQRPDHPAQACSSRGHRYHL